MHPSWDVEVRDPFVAGLWASCGVPVSVVFGLAFAIAALSAPKNTAVRVVDVRGLTLRVRRAPESGGAT